MEALQKSKPVQSVSLTLKRMAESSGNAKKSKRPKLEPFDVHTNGNDASADPDDPCEVNVSEVNVTQEVVASSIVEDVQTNVDHVNEALQKQKDQPLQHCHDECKEHYNDSDWWWVGCRYRSFCLSFQKRLGLTGKKGGDWFHSSCVGVVQRHRKNEHWVCSLCSNEHPSELARVARQKQQDRKECQESKSGSALSFLKKELDKENRKVVKIVGDGNCLFRSFACMMYGNQEFHATVRSQMCLKLNEIYDKFEGRWSVATCPSGPELLNNEAYFVFKLVHWFSSEVDAKCVDSEEVTKEQMMAFINLKKTPHSSQDHGKAKWGGLLELHLHALVNRKNVWVLREYVGSDSAIQGYVLEHIVSFRSRDHYPHEEDIVQDYDLLLWEGSKEHYSAVLPARNKNVPLPICQRIYNYAGSMSQNVCQNCS